MLGVGNTAEVFEYGEGKVCKLFFAGYPKEAVEREYRNAMEVERLGLPAPKVYATVTLDGRNGIVYEKIEGKSMLECIFENQEGAAALLERFVQIQKEWLTACYDAVLSYKQFLKELTKGKEKTHATLSKEIEALPEGDVLLHGDFHPGNVLLTPDNRTVVIDFMNVCCGPALYDIARTFFLFREKDKNFAQTYLTFTEVSEADILPFYKVIELCRKYEK